MLVGTPGLVLLLLFYSYQNHQNHDELEATANLLILYVNIISTKNGNKGTFIQAVRILTNGQIRSQKQYPVAQPLKVDIGAEIKHMTTEGITKSYVDLKSFNSSVFAVRKKNRSICIGVNFKSPQQSLSQC